MEDEDTGIFPDYSTGEVDEEHLAHGMDQPEYFSNLTTYSDFLAEVARRRQDRKGTALGPPHPPAKTKLTHDHSAFLCSLFNRINLDNTTQGPFSTKPAFVNSIIADAVEQHKPVGDEDLPLYNGTISNMVINASKKVFNSDFEDIPKVSKISETSASQIFVSISIIR